MNDTVIHENKYLRNKNIPESRDSVIPSLHIDGTKYRIFSIKIDAAKNITIHEMTKSIDSNTILEVTDDKGVIDLIINLKCIVILVDPRLPF